MDNPAEPHLLRSLINASEKASNIARICRSDEKLLSLLVQEKTGEEANVRFEHDFKTLADVLIQETIKHDIGVLFPAIRDAIKGEESPNFTNTLGESVAIAVGNTQENTVQCLASILLNDLETAEVLAAEVHRDVIYNEPQLGDIPALPTDLDYTNLGIWIDPIDATAEYISGENTFTKFHGIPSTGLDCVTVLIGVYNRSTGEPIIGVVSQPFHNKVSEQVYSSQIFWGVSLANLQANNINNHIKTTTTNGSNSNRLGIFSSSENSDILERVSQLDYVFAFSAGAGHKSLKVITSEADIYVLSKGSTFKWDTCAPHAILNSLGGNILNFKESIKQSRPVPINYLESADQDDDWKCNKDGLIAIRDVSLVQTLLETLRDS